MTGGGYKEIRTPNIFLSVTMVRLALLVVLLMGAPCGHAAQVYKWSDSTGVHYSDRPPPGGEKTRVISIGGAGKTPAATTASSQGGGRRHSRTQPLESHADIERRKRERSARALKSPGVTTYRTIDGSNNNPAHPDWGRADIEFIRLTTSDYGDGAGTPAGTGRPSPREISNTVVAHPGVIFNEGRASDFVWQWGQFLDHDLDLTPTISPVEPFDIPVPRGDPYFDPGGTGTAVIPLDRSLYAPGTGVRQQLNIITAYIDASNVYGSTPEVAAALRTLDGTGRMKTGERDLLPVDPADATRFIAGDVRSNEVVSLTAMHTLFVREHNYWAERFRNGNPGMSGEEVYQTARMMVAAELQRITYEEFLPVLLGRNALAPYRGYRRDVNPGISNEFATAAYRFGHSMISAQLLRLDSRNRPDSAGHLPLRSAFFNPSEISRHGIDSLLRGLAFNVAQRVDVHIVDDLRNFLFGAPGAGGFDLASLNIQRGRDHGLPSYNETRRRLGLSARAGFAEVSSDPDVQARLSAVYKSVEEVDLWVGGLAEDHVRGALVGETIRAIVKDQFERLRDGDRFWHESYLPANLLGQVRSQNLAKIIRRNTGIRGEIQDNVFIAPAKAGSKPGRGPN